MVKGSVVTKKIRFERSASCMNWARPAALLLTSQFRGSCHMALALRRCTLSGVEGHTALNTFGNKKAALLRQLPCSLAG